MNIDICPCKGCKDRIVGGQSCHSTCYVKPDGSEGYIPWKSRIDKKNAIIRAAKKQEAERYRKR